MRCMPSSLLQGVYTPLIVPIFSGLTWYGWLGSNACLSFNAHYAIIIVIMSVTGAVKLVHLDKEELLLKEQTVTCSSTTVVEISYPLSVYKHEHGRLEFPLDLYNTSLKHEYSYAFIQAIKWIWIS